MLTTAPARPIDAARPSAWRSGWVALVLSAVSRAALTMVAGLVLWSVLPAAFGWHATVVMSDSMAPRLRVGDVAISRPVADGQPLRPGQVLLVSDPDHPDRLRLHRLTAIRPDGQLTLRGDANRADDSSPVARTAVHGIGSLRVPFVGSPAYWLSTGQQGRVVLLALALGGLIGGAVAFRPTESTEDSDEADSDGSDSDGSDSAGLDGSAASADVTPTHRRRAIAAFVIGAVTVAGVGMASPAAQAATRFGASTSNNSTWAAATYFSCKNAVLAGRPYFYYQLGEATAGNGAVATDSSSNGRNGTYESAMSAGTPGPCKSGPTGVTLDGSNDWISTGGSVAGPNTFTIQAWFKTTTTSGGELIGFSSYSLLLDPLNYDRHLYLTNGGQVVFGVYPGSVQTIASPKPYNDGKWHQATATLSSAGMQLYVDGVRVANNASVTTAQAYTGYWRIGWNKLDGWTSTPSSRYFAGSLAGVAVYTSALSAADIEAGYATAGS